MKGKIVNFLNAYVAFSSFILVFFILIMQNIQKYSSLSFCFPPLLFISGCKQGDDSYIRLTNSKSPNPNRAFKQGDAKFSFLIICVQCKFFTLIYTSHLMLPAN